MKRVLLKHHTPSIFSRSAIDVELGPRNLAHCATSQSIFDVNGLYGFDGEGFPSEVAYALCDGDAEPMGSPA